MPQGSVLGPYLFSLVIDNLSSSNVNTKIVKYADDICLLHFVRQPNDDRLQEEWNWVESWTEDVGLSLNRSKCCVMNIITKNGLTLQSVKDRTGANITTTSCVKLLGVTFSEDMRWNTHITNVIKKASRRLYVLYNLKHANCPTDMMYKVYVALIRSILLYCYPCFCNSPAYLKEKLVGVEKRALRIIGDSNRSPSFLATADNLCQNLFKKASQSEDHPLRRLFQKRPHPLNTRSKNTFNPPFTKTERLKNSFVKYCVQ